MGRRELSQVKLEELFSVRTDSTVGVMLDKSKDDKTVTVFPLPRFHNK